MAEIDLRTMCKTAETKLRDLVDAHNMMVNNQQQLAEAIAKKRNDIIAASGALSALRTALGEPVPDGTLPENFLTAPVA